MMGKLQIIEQHIMALEGGAFQNLCDVYLTLKYQDSRSFNRTGSQFGTQKTVKGTPDTFFRVDGDKLSFVEFTTKEHGLVTKINDDINKCSDQSKTGISIDDISSVIVCFNSRLTVAEENAIQQHAQDVGIAVQLIGLDMIAIDILTRYPILSKEVLGIPLDTGQMLPLNVFTDEYNNKGGQLSTPLNNEFLHRTAELQDVETELAIKDMVILTGAAGVGKTKVALQAVNAFLATHPSFSAFVIAKKDVDISTDLRMYLDQEKDFVLVVDDANRQLLNFKQILGVFKEVRKGQIKLILTVTDYALSDILIECTGYAYSVVQLKKFSDQEITDIISSDSFEIRNKEYQRKIVELADGNARLAVMAAKLAKEKNHEFLYGTVSTLYDEYFSTFVNDFDTLKDKTVLKTLGLLSFFFSIHRDDKAFISTLLDHFGIDHFAFHEAITELEQRELIEVQYNVARVSEQVMATYFFYKVFIKDKLLSFETLLLNYFPEWRSRFSDTIIPANNTFGYEKVLNEINTTLSTYLNTYKGDEEKILAFFSLFWFYKPDETLAYFYEKTLSLPTPTSPVYDTHHERNDHVWDDDQTLKQLVHFFDHDTESFVSSVELSFEYCKRLPEKLPVLIRRITERIEFEHEDERIRFSRQNKLFDLIISKANVEDEIYQKAQFALAPAFLKYQYQVTKGGRGNTITWYNYTLPTDEATKDFRKKLWDSLFALFPTHEEDVLKILRSLRVDHHDPDKQLIAFDLTQLIPFVTEHLDTQNFTHVHFVQHLVQWVDREDLLDESYRDLQHSFMNDAYKLFRKLDWSTLRGRHEYDFENHEEFERLKEADIRASITFTDASEFDDFFHAITNALAVDVSNDTSVWRTVDIVVEETFAKNHKLGFELLQKLFTHTQIGIFTLHKTLHSVIRSSDEDAARLWTMLKNWKSNYQIFWLLHFFDHLSDHLFNADYSAKLLVTVQSIDKGVTLRLDTLARFLSVRENIIAEIAEIVYKKNEELNLGVKYWHKNYDVFYGYLREDQHLLEKTYLQQEIVNGYHDYNNEGLKLLVSRSPDFLLLYIKAFYAHGKRIDRIKNHDSLTFAWDIVNPEVINTALDEMIAVNRWYGMNDHPTIIFFNKLTDEQKEKAQEFLLLYIAKNYQNDNRMDVIMNVIRHKMPGFEEIAFHSYLDATTDLENFTRIKWTSHPGVMNGDVIWGQIRADKWQKVADMLQRYPRQLPLIPIKNYVKETISQELQSAEHERMRKFLTPDW